LSTPGELCLYHAADFAFEEGGIITKDKAIQNPGKVGVILLARNAVVIDVNKIMPDIEEHRHDIAKGGERATSSDCRNSIQYIKATCNEDQNPFDSGRRLFSSISKSVYIDLMIN
jgi:hypothetical protein